MKTKITEDISIPTIEVNHLHKDRFFKRLMQDPKRLKETAKLLSGMDSDDIQVSNVHPILFGNRENDLAFLLNSIFYFMVEVNSTFSPNMAFRMLNYLVAAYLKFLEKEDLYGRTPLKLKTPKLYTLFTGICKQAPAATVSIQRLSDNFEALEEKPDVEVIVHIYDFNMTESEIIAYLNHNLTPSRLSLYQESSLFWYAMFVNSVKYKYKGIPPYDKAQKTKAVEQLCVLFKSRGIFVELFNDREVINMTVMEFSRENELFYEGKIEGKIEGMIEGKIETITNGLKEGQSLELLLKITGLSQEQYEDYIH